MSQFRGLAKALQNALVMGLVLLTLLVSGQPVMAAEVGLKTAGAQIFEVHCAGCHINGGNIVRRNKTLKLNALKRNGVDSLDAISEIVANGKGNMSAYRDRLSEQEIHAVAAYVLERAQQNWQKR